MCWRSNNFAGRTNSKKKVLKLNSFEASLLALGIYEDTGALTYATTTARDAACVTFLLKAGADLQLINQYMRTKLNDSQQALFRTISFACPRN